jgi:hypothetical protein
MRQYTVSLLTLLLIVLIDGSTAITRASPARQGPDYTRWRLASAENMLSVLDDALATTYPEYDHGDPTPDDGIYFFLPLAPDGNTVVAKVALLTRADTEEADPETLYCIYRLDAAEIMCAPPPEDTPFAKFPSPKLRHMAWSPDSTGLVLHEDWARANEESDLWHFDVTTGTWTDLTDDGVSSYALTDAATGKTDPVEAPYVLDYTPVWNPANGDLYFFRTDPRQGFENVALYRLPAVGGDPEFVRDLTPDIPERSLVYFVTQAAISPNGTQMALTVLSDQPENSAMWLIDLADSHLTDLPVYDYLQMGLPDWAFPGLPAEIRWNSDGTRLILRRDWPWEAVISIPQPYVAIDPATGAATPLLDHTGTSQDAYAALGRPQTFLPFIGLLAPDGSSFFFWPYANPEIFAVPITFDAKPAKIGELPTDNLRDIGWFYDFGNPLMFTISPNGRVLFGHYLLTFEHR